MGSNELKPHNPDARIMEILAALAQRKPLRGIQIVCETQHQISTRKLEQYLELAGDDLAGYAFKLRQDFDAMRQRAEAAELELSGINNAKQELARLLGCEEPRWSAMILEATDLLPLRIRVELLEGLLRDYNAQHRCGCGHSACKRCQDDAEIDDALAQQVNP